MELRRFVIYVALLFFPVRAAYTARVPRFDPASSVSSQLKELVRESDSPDGGNVACMIEHCLTHSIACLVDNTCRTYVECSQKCMNEWDNDTTPGKFHVQNCTNMCSFTYNDKTIDDFMSCVSEHKCVTFPPIPNPCHGSDVHPLKQLSLDDIKDSWWIVRGYHPVFDCYPCAHPNFEPTNATFWSYNPTYFTYLVNGTLKLVHQHFEMPYQAPGKNITFVYHDMGLDHSKTWWIIDQANDKSYTLLYYCGNTLQWYYEGAIVLARNRSLSEGAYADIAVSYQKAVGLNLTNFCFPTTSKCTDYLM